MNKHQLSGFTLLELMIVVVIVGIIASLAFGYYGNQVIASKRTDGRRAMIETAASLEKCRALYSDYTSVSCNVAFPVTSQELYYSIEAPAIFTPTTFTLVGTPQGSQGADAECATMTLTSTGIKAGTGTVPANCW